MSVTKSMTTDGLPALRLRRIACWILPPLYLILYFVKIPSPTGWSMPFTYPLWGPLFHLFFFWIGMWAFVRREVPAKNYMIALLLIAFYLLLYANRLLYIPGTVHPFRKPALLLGLGNKWFLYGALYTAFIVGFGIRFLLKRGSDRYQRIRTLSLMGVQSVAAFIIPLAQAVGGGREYYLSYFWPLKIEYLYPDTIAAFSTPVILYSLLGSLLLFPLLALLFGKRFYCSWVCGCGGLAETFGDSWRHLSDKSPKAWRLEKISIHSVLILAIVSTGLIAADHFIRAGGGRFFLSGFTTSLRGLYSFVITFALAGAAGTGFYPVLGSRVWCRFFCPMAAMLGLIQKAGRFRIRVKPDMCISCGNCSTYCEMGIDVRAYAQENRSFCRASCVGCGMCAHVCPRGVLRLENGGKIFRKEDG